MEDGPGTPDQALPMCSSLPSERSATCRPGRAPAAPGWLHPWPGDSGGPVSLCSPSAAGAYPPEGSGGDSAEVGALPAPHSSCHRRGPRVRSRLQIPQPLSSSHRRSVGLGCVPLSRPSPCSERWGRGAGADTPTTQEGEPQLPVGTGVFIRRGPSARPGAPHGVGAQGGMGGGEAATSGWLCEVAVALGWGLLSAPPPLGQSTRGTRKHIQTSYLSLFPAALAPGTPSWSMDLVEKEAPALEHATAGGWIRPGGPSHRPGLPGLLGRKHAGGKSTPGPGPGPWKLEEPVLPRAGQRGGKQRGEIRKDWVRRTLCVPLQS